MAITITIAFTFTEPLLYFTSNGSGSIKLKHEYFAINALRSLKTFTNPHIKKEVEVVILLWVSYKEVELTKVDMLKELYLQGHQILL